MLKLYDTLRKQKIIFEPRFKKQVGLYVCGITAYDYCHVGNARVFIVFDVLIRYLRWLGYAVNYTRNITDIDDKIIQRAQAENKNFQVIADYFSVAFQVDMQALNVLLPTHEPRATDYITQMILAIQALIDIGYAYVGEDKHVYYQVGKFKAYGQLSKQNLVALHAGARVAVATAKQDPADFVLWKLAKSNEPSWDSPWGQGRPGWHIECSTLATQCLKQHFDIHGGGLDLIFPHHENEIAQAEAGQSCKFMNYWLHVGFVTINKEKMSKSAGNFFTVREVCAKYSPEVVRYFILASHYRRSLQYSEENLQQASAALDRLYTALRAIVLPPQPLSLVAYYETRFRVAMDDDLNTPAALAVLFELAHEINKLREVDLSQAQQLASTLYQLGGLLGLLSQDPIIFLQGNRVLVQQIETLVIEREQMRAKKNWVAADQLRLDLENLGVIIEDTMQGTTWRKA